MSREVTPFSRVITPTGRTGTVVEPPWVMPFHCLVELDDGEVRWFLVEILRPIEETTTPRAKKTTKLDRGVNRCLD